MIYTDIVLFNEWGCEIARETVTEEMTENKIISQWKIYPGDRIEVQEIWHEQ